MHALAEAIRPSRLRISSDGAIAHCVAIDFPRSRAADKSISYNKIPLLLIVGADTRER
jgi:hypothetical protein